MHEHIIYCVNVSNVNKSKNKTDMSGKGGTHTVETFWTFNQPMASTDYFGLVSLDGNLYKRY